MVLRYLLRIKTMTIPFDPEKHANILEEIEEISTKKSHEMAKEIVEKYRFTLTSMIKEDLFHFKTDLSGKANKNKRQYQNRKKNLGGGTTPLVFRSHYVNSIKVFEDTTGLDGNGNRVEAENEENQPRFYVETPEANGIFGYYVDVEDVYHEPSPLEYTALSRHFNVYYANVAAGKKGFTQKIKNLRKTEAFAEAGASSTGVSMRWLKSALEYGTSKSGPRFHWGYVTDMFLKEYGTASQIMEKARVQAVEEINTKYGNS